MKVALFGGSFNPPHLGHLMACYYALHNGFDLVVMLPVFTHPLGKKLIPFHHRIEMCYLLSDFDSEKIVINRAEAKNKSGLTADLMKCFKFYKGNEYHWLIGSDCMEERHNWERFDEVEKKVKLFPVVRFGMMWNSNDGYVGMSSTNVRKALAMGENSPILTGKVFDYIKYHGIDKSFTKDGGIL